MTYDEPYRDQFDETVLGRDPDGPVLRLSRWSGPIEASDPDAGFKQDIADYSRLDPLKTLGGMARGIGVPVGAVARYVIARWATGGSGGLMEVGPDTVAKLNDLFVAAEEVGDDEARLVAYEKARGLVSWLAAPLGNDEYYSG